MLIKVVPKDKSSEFFELTGHEGPVFRIDLSTNGLLASSSGDGTLKIWDLDERKVVKTFSDLEKAKSYQATNIFGMMIIAFKKKFLLTKVLQFFDICLQ